MPRDRVGGDLSSNPGLPLCGLGETAFPVSVPALVFRQLRKKRAGIPKLSGIRLDPSSPTCSPLPDSHATGLHQDLGLFVCLIVYVGALRGGAKSRAFIYARQALYH